MDEATHELYGLDPGEFVAARNELARQLRTAGDREQAAEVAKLRRPSPAAWALNQLTRRHRADVEELVRLGEALRGAQDRALAGEAPAELRQAARARRDAVAKLAGMTDRLLVERGGAPGSNAAEVTGTLEAASLDADAAAAVLDGRLSTELHPPSGFGAFEPGTTSTARAKAPGPGPDSPELEEAEEAAAEARGRWEERRSKARTAVEQVTVSRKAAKEVEAEVARIEDQLEEAQRRLRRAVREAEHAEDAAARAEDTAAKAAERLRKAEQRLKELDGT